MARPTKAQLRALEGVRNREVALDRYGSLVYDGKEISGAALAACRRRDWTYVARDLGPHGRVSLTADGSDALDAALDQQDDPQPQDEEER